MSFIYCAYSPGLDRRSVRLSRRHVFKFGFCKDLSGRLDTLRNGWKVGEKRGPPLALQNDWDFLDHWPASRSTERRLFDELSARRHAFDLLSVVTAEMLKAAQPGLECELNGIGELRCFSRSSARDLDALQERLRATGGVVAAAIECACSHIASLHSPLAAC